MSDRSAARSRATLPRTLRAFLRPRHRRWLLLAVAVVVVLVVGSVVIVHVAETNARSRWEMTAGQVTKQRADDRAARRAFQDVQTRTATDAEAAGKLVATSDTVLNADARKKVQDAATAAAAAVKQTHSGAAAERVTPPTSTGVSGYDDAASRAERVLATNTAGTRMTVAATKTITGLATRLHDAVTALSRTITSQNAAALIAANSEADDTAKSNVTAAAKHIDPSADTATQVQILSDYVSTVTALRAAQTTAAAAKAAAEAPIADSTAGTSTSTSISAGTSTRSSRGTSGTGSGTSGHTGSSGSSRGTGSSAAGSSSGAGSSGSSAGSPAAPAPAPAPAASGPPPNYALQHSRHVAACDPGEFTVSYGPNVNSMPTRYLTVSSTYTDGAWVNSGTTCG